ncbi:MAG: tetratricopeptide repeat protein [Streptomycetaceae bacterium]|nr:tetratricopeptide repeat protein [Streptomycetaceae bacterium]
MEFQVLGPLQAVHDGRAAYVPTGHKPRLLLAVLLARKGRPVSLDALVEAIWGAKPPASARRNVHQYVSHLRGALGGELIATLADGYTLAAGVALDADRFRDLHAAARVAFDADDHPTAARTWRAALDLWRGPAYADLADAPAVVTEADLLEQLRWSATEGWADAELALGRHRPLAEALEALVADQPFREHLHCCLMLALYRGGRRADALESFRRAAHRLRDDLGIDPGPELRRLHEAMLRDDPRLTAPGRYSFAEGQDAAAGQEAAVGQEAAAGQEAAGHDPAETRGATEDGGSGAATVPRQLPADVPAFTGRVDALAALDEHLLAAETTDPDSADAPRIALVGGGAGVGKTSLAVHWAHRAAARFPDGQLHVNLRGFDPAGPPVTPSQAIRGFLDALGVPSARIPADLDGQVGLFRSVVAGRRLLLVLDNARDAEQVRPLLPGARTCVTVVTSRNRLTGLVATDGARPVPVDMFSAAEARQLMTDRLGSAALDRDPAAVDDVIARCGGLPLALAIVAARAATDRALPMAALARELRDDGATLDAFAGDDAATDLRAVFSWSYHQLTAPAARVFRLLGLHPGPDISSAAAASTAGLPIRGIRPLLAELTRASLVTEHAPGRFVLHDLMRAYAAELVADTDPEAVRTEALRRAYDHYLQTADRANLLVYPHRHRIAILPPADGVTPQEHADRDHAYAWFAAEHAVMLAVIRQAYDLGCDGHTWQLAWTLITYFDRQGHWHDQAATQRIALDAAVRSGDVTGQAHVRHGLGVSSTWLERYDEAQEHYDHAIALFRQQGDRGGEANTLLALTWLGERTTRYDSAYVYAERAYHLHRAAGDRSGQAKALNTMGWFQTLLGDHDAAIVACEQALALHQEVGDVAGQWETWDSLGHARHHLGRHTEAVACYENARDLVRQTRDRYWEAIIDDHLAEAYAALGDTESTHAARREAVRILEELGHADADEIRAKLP